MRDGIYPRAVKLALPEELPKSQIKADQPQASMAIDGMGASH